MSGDCAIQDSATDGNWKISITSPTPNDRPLGSNTWNNPGKKKLKMSGDCAIQNSATDGNWKIPITVISSQWQTIGVQYRDHSRWSKRRKDGGWLESDRCVQHSTFNHSHGWEFEQLMDVTNHSHAEFGMTEIRGERRERQVGGKFHLNTFYIMREMQIVSYLNIFQSVIEAECIPKKFASRA